MATKAIREMTRRFLKGMIGSNSPGGDGDAGVPGFRATLLSNRRCRIRHRRRRRRRHGRPILGKQAGGTRGEGIGTATTSHRVLRAAAAAAAARITPKSGVMLRLVVEVALGVDEIEPTWAFVGLCRLVKRKRKRKARFFLFLLLLPFFCNVLFFPAIFLVLCRNAPIFVSSTFWHRMYVICLGTVLPQRERERERERAGTISLGLRARADTGWAGCQLAGRKRFQNVNSRQR